MLSYATPDTELRHICKYASQDFLLLIVQVRDENGSDSHFLNNFTLHYFLIKGWKYKVTFEINILKPTYLIFNIHFAIVQISFGQVERTRANVHILVEFRQFPHIPISKIQSEDCSFVRLFLHIFAH